MIVEGLENRTLLSGLPPDINLSPDCAYTLTGDATAETLTVTEGAIAFNQNDGANGSLPNLSVVFTGSAVAAINSPLTLVGLTVSGTANVTVTSSGGGATGNLLDITGPSGFSMPLDPTTNLPTATLDMMDNDIILRGAGDAELPVIRTLLKDGKTGAGLKSSDAANSPSTEKTALGYGDGFTSFDGLSTIDGQAVSTTDLVIKYTLSGDASLNGIVDNADQTAVSNGWGQTGVYWRQGDFSLDGRVSNVDEAMLSNNWENSILGPNFNRTLQPVGQSITTVEGQAFTGALATFTDTLNTSSTPTNAGDYTATVSWGNNSFVPATVTADTDPGDPQGYVISATSPAPLSNADALFITMVQYAAGTGLQGRPASLGEPIVTITPAVSDLAAVPVSASQIDLYWTANATNATSFEVDRADDGGAFVMLTNSVSGSTTTFADATVSAGHSYIYQIRAIQPIGPSAFTDPADVTTDAVQGLAATAASTTAIDLSWINLSTDPNATVDVQREGPGDSAFTTIATGLAGDSTSFHDAGLPEGTHYVYQVVIHEPSRSNPDTLSNSADTWTLPAAPSAVTVTSTASGEVDLRWMDNSLNSPSFLIERASTDGNYTIVGATGPGITIYADTTVEDGTNYTFRVDSMNGGGESPSLDTASAATPLAAPSGLSALSVSTSEIDLYWTNNSKGATGFKVERSIGDQTHFVTLPPPTDDPLQTTYTDSGLAPGTLYYYRVSATTSSQTSAATAIVSAATAAAISISGDSTAAEGTPYTLNTVVTHASGLADPVTGWSLDWGDGSTATISGDPGSFQHTYTEPGSYTITAATSDGAFSGTQAVTVAEEPASLTLPASLGNPVVVNAGVGVSLPFTFADPGGDPVKNWLVDWGDGQESTLPGGSGNDSPPTAITQTFTHSYANAGIIYTVNAVATTDDGIYAARATVQVNGTAPWASDNLQVIPDSVAASEGNDGFGITFLDQNGSGPVTYAVNWGDNTANTTFQGMAGAFVAYQFHNYDEEGQYVLSVTGSDGAAAHVLTNVSETKPTMTTTPDQLVSPGQPVDVTVNYAGLGPKDGASAWVDWADGTGSQPASISGGASGTVTAHLDHAPAGERTAVVAMADNDSGNSAIAAFVIGTPRIVIDGVPDAKKMSDGAVIVDDPSNPSSRFLRVTVFVPDIVPFGSTVTVSINAAAAGEAELVQGPSADPSDPVLLGGAGPQSYSWTVGGFTNPFDLWLRGLAASQAQRDIVLTEKIQTPTAQATDQAAATDYEPKIIYTPDSAGAAGIDITSKVTAPTPILVGQLAPLSLAGDLGMAAGTHWGTEGEIFKSYTATDPNASGASSASIQRLAPTDWVGRNVKWYYEPWFTGSSDAVADIECAGTIKGKSFRLDSAFDVYRPVSSFSTTVGVVDKAFSAAGRTVYRFGPHADLNANLLAGVQYDIMVTVAPLPAPLNAPGGTYHITQLITSVSYIRTLTGQLQARTHNGQRVLDGSIAYGGKIFPVGQAAQQHDNPGNEIGTPGATPGSWNWSADWTSRFDHFDDYLMFVPAGTHSMPVAVKYLYYEWGGAVYLDKNLNKWKIDGNFGAYPSQVTTVNSVDATEQPVWSDSNRPLGFNDIWAD